MDSKVSMENNKDLKSLKKILSEEYYQFRKRFNIRSKGIINVTSEDIEDIFHDLLLKVIEYAAYSKFEYIDRQSTINYINKTFTLKIKDLNKLKEEDCSNSIGNIDNISNEGDELFLYIAKNFDSGQIEKSVFNSLFKDLTR